MSISWCMSMSMSMSMSSTKYMYISPTHSNHISSKLTLNPLPNFSTLSSPKPSLNTSKSKLVAVRCLNVDQSSESSTILDNYAQKHKPTRWENVLSTAASLYPVYVTVGGVIACLSPSTFSWFVNRAPFSYSLSLGLIMLSMGLTLELRDLLTLFMQRPFSILVGCVAQYTIMPSLGVLVSKFLGLPPAATVGLILLACCPGGTASNVVTLIARGDVPLSIVMTMCTTITAVLVTPLLTKYLAGTYVPVDAVQLSISTLQVVVAPIFLGSFFQSTVPSAVRVVTPYAPLFAVLTSSLLACSVFSENVVRLKSLIASTPSVTLNAGQTFQIKALLSSELGVTVLSVLLLHSAGFLLGYVYSAICGFRESQRRAISIEVGMQNSSLGVVLAASHFSSPMVALPAALSAVIMNIMGSSLAFVWRNIDTTDNHK